MYEGSSDLGGLVSGYENVNKDIIRDEEEKVKASKYGVERCSCGQLIPKGQGVCKVCFRDWLLGSKGMDITII